MFQYSKTLKVLLASLLVMAPINACARLSPHVAEAPLPVPDLALPGRVEQELPAVQQTLAWGELRQSRAAAPGTLFAATGRRLYVLGDIDGRFRPRSNPYDLYNFGKPQPQDPLANRLQGVWAQPVKALNGYTFVVDTGEEPWALLQADTFSQSLDQVRFDFRRGSLSAVRQDFVPQDLPLLLTTLTLENKGSQPVEGRLIFYAYFDLQDAWFTTLARERNSSETVRVNGDRLVAQAKRAPNAWAVAVGAEQTHAGIGVTPGQDDHPVGWLEFPVRMESGETRAWTIGVAVESQAGTQAALQTLENGLSQRGQLLAEKRSLYMNLWSQGPHLSSPDAKLDAAFELARANMQLLEAESPALGRYFYAGLETFPFWFSNDGAYSASGLAAAGFASPLKNHFLIGVQTQEKGRIPHQVSPSGRVVGSGNAQETPQWVSGAWDVYRWTGDLDFLKVIYPQAVSGLFDYTLGAIDQDGDGFPSGPGIVERQGMGAEKLDTAAYTWRALLDLAEMAQTLGDSRMALRALDQAGKIAAQFDPVWWDTVGGTYAMSLAESNNQQIPVPHWAVVTPLEVGLATSQHARLTLDTLQTKYLNQWGLKHTVGEDERVWTLPTATLSRAAYRYGQPELGFAMLQHLYQSLEAGSIGMFHELIPEGLCFVQLWSGATLVRGVVEDVFGLYVEAGKHSISIAPQLPSEWQAATLEDLPIGDHRISVSITAERVSVLHVQGPVALTVNYPELDGSLHSASLLSGQKLEFPRIRSQSVP